MKEETVATLITAAIGVVGTIVGAIIGGLIASRVASAANTLQEKIAADNRYAQERAALDAMLVRMLEFLMEHPYLEKDEFCQSYPTVSGHPHAKERYEVYCIFVFNFLMRAFKHFGCDGAKLGDYIGLEEIIGCHHRWWNHDKKNLDYDDPFRACIQAVYDKMRIIDGCTVDAKEMKRWLGTNPGGAWDEDDICVLHNRSLETIDQGMRWVRKADFAFVAFSGHGQINEVNGKRKQVVYVGEGTAEEIDFSRLKPDCERSIVICDACRRVHIQKPFVKSFTENVQKYARAAQKRYSRADYQREYLRLVGEADGRYMIYSCSPNQFSGDDENNGGRFTSALLESAQDWYVSAGPLEFYTIGQAFGAATPLVSGRSRAQNSKYPQDPEAFSSVRGVSSKYPFVIHFE